MQIICYALLVLCLIGCSAPVRREDPTVVSQLRGYIRPEKEIYQQGEEIVIHYWVANATNALWEETVVDGSQEIDQAFQGYTFNAALVDHPEVPLQLKEAGPPFQGLLKLDPKKERLFCQNTFGAEQSGRYQLQFELRWREGKRVVFSPEIIEVQSPASQKAVQQWPAPLQDAFRELANPDPRVVQQAQLVILSYEKEAIPGLIEMMGTKDEQLREEATKLLVALKQAAVPALLEAIHHPLAEIRIGSLTALSQIGHLDAFIEFKKALLDDVDRRVRLIALEIVFETCGDEIAIPLLIQALDDQELVVRLAAWEALQKRVGAVIIPYYPEASAMERQELVKRWKEWWLQGHSGG